MGYHCCMAILLPLYLLSNVPFLSQAHIGLPLKAVNLGNWLLIEDWIESSVLFRHIPNRDLLDGTQVQLMSTKLQKFLSAENGGGTIVVANESSASSWETFRLWRINEITFNLRVYNKQFVGLENQGQGKKIVAVSHSAGYSETFEIIRKSDDPFRVRIRANNGFFLQAQSETLVTADYGDSGWEDDNPSVFQLKIVSILEGEYQLTNGYGPLIAPIVMQEHWNTYITEEDFNFMSANGLNAVRIPVGWWIAHDPEPPKPFVGGSLKALDNAFRWAQKYGMKVIIDLHAVQCAQNTYVSSATRDGVPEWTARNVPDTVAVIEFLASRYANNPSLIAIGLMNEPVSVNSETLKNYYKAAYAAIRKYTSSAYVMLSSVGSSDYAELLSFATGRNRIVIDVHYYSVYSDFFKTMNAQQNIDYIYNQRWSDLSTITKSNGPLSSVGEWTCEWNVSRASMQDYQRFCRAQLDVYGRATFGWAYWTYKCTLNHWSLRWMIENKYIMLTGS